LLIISSNDKKEYSFCHEIINVSDFKKNWALGIRN
jgi:hypothetical protein